MSKGTSSTIFKKLVSSPVGIIAEFIVNKLAIVYGYEPLRNYFLEIQTGKTPPMSNPEYYSSNDIEWIKPSDIGYQKHITASDWISYKAVKENKATIYKPNTVLIICIGGGIGRLGIVDKTCSSNQQITGILFKNEVLSEYVYYFFLSRNKIFEENSSKSTLPIINQKGLGNLNFTCPNISVQKEVIRFLEYCKECLEGFSYPINSSFNLSNDILEFSKKAFKAFYTQRSLLSEYETQLAQLENLNQAILQEAVQGKLVPQDPNDEPASELLKRIKIEKSKSGKKDKSLPPIKPEEIPFEIPENWVWYRLGEICSKITDGTHHSPINSKIGAYKYVTAKNIKNAGVDLSNITYVTEQVHQEIYSRCNPSFGDILYIKDGATTGIVTINQLNEEFSMLSSVALLKLPDLIYNKYVMFTMRSPYFYKATRDGMYGVAITRVTLQKINNLIIPLPPLSEQKRIVGEIEKQLSITKQLKEHIIANQQATEQLLKALLHQAFEVREMEEV